VKYPQKFLSTTVKTDEIFDLQKKLLFIQPRYGRILLAEVLQKSKVI